MHSTTHADPSPASDARRAALIGEALSRAVDAGCSPHALKLLLYILRALRPDGTAEISMAEFSEHAQRHRTTVLREVQELERAGLIIGHRQQRGPKLFEVAPALRQTIYYIAFVTGEDAPPVENSAPDVIHTLHRDASDVADTLPQEPGTPKSSPPAPPVSLYSRSRSNDDDDRAREPSSSSEFFTKMTGEGIDPLTVRRLEAQLSAEQRAEWCEAVKYLPQTVVSRSGYILRLIERGKLPTPYVRQTAPPIRSNVTPIAAARKGDPITPALNADERAESERKYREKFLAQRAALFGNRQAAQ